MAANEDRNIERPTDPVYHKIVHDETSIQQDMFEKRCSAENIPAEYSE